MTGAIAQNYDGIIYVTPTGVGTHSGSNWANATFSFSEAQYLARSGVYFIKAVSDGNVVAVRKVVKN